MIVFLTLAACAKDDNSVGQAPSSSASATGSPTPTESPSATCDEPSETKIQLVAKNAHFSVKCLVVPAGEPVTVALRNKSFANHNFAIYTLEFASEFTGDITYPEERVTYKVPAPASTCSKATSTRPTCPARSFSSDQSSVAWAMA